jgi:hypothetical protein
VSRTPDLKLHAIWREHIRRQVDSRLTVAQFCARERLSVASFYTWKRRLRLIDLTSRHSGLPALPAFLPVTVRVPEHALSEPLAIEADLPNGVRLRIPTKNARLACRLVCLITQARTDSGGSKC